MPKPYKGKSASILDFNPNHLIKHQAMCAGFIGAVALQWSAIEALLAHLYALLVFGDREAWDMGEHIAIESFESVASFGAKRKLLLRATEIRLGKETAEKFSQVLHKVHKAYESRNKIIHARWTVATEPPHELVRRSTLLSGERPMIYQKDDIAPVVRKLVKAYVDLANFFFTEIQPILKETPLTKMIREMFSTQKTKGTG